jgi:hypothetical protein
MYLRGSSFAQKWQVESPVNTSGFFYSTCSRAPLNALREWTLATQSYLGQHRSSFTLADQGQMPEEVKHDYWFCQYHNPPLAHNNGPCDCLTWTNGTKWSSSVPPVLVVTLDSTFFQNGRRCRMTPAISVRWRHIGDEAKLQSNSN